VNPNIRTKSITIQRQWVEIQLGVGPPWVKRGGGSDGVVAVAPAAVAVVPVADVVVGDDLSVTVVRRVVIFGPWAAAQ
jgi:uncharacterized protein YhdP